MTVLPVKPIFSMRTNRRTDMTKLITAFRYFADTPKKRQRMK